MGWIISGIAETIVSVIGDLLTFLLTCFTNFDLDIGYSEGQSFGDMFTLDYYKSATGLVDSVFPEASIFFSIFVYVAYIIVILAIISKITSAMLGPLGGNDESPLKSLGRGVLAAAGVTYSYTIFIMIEMFANTIYGMFKEKFLLLTDNELPALSDYLLNQSSFFGDSNVLSQIAFLFLEIGLFTVLLIQFLRLLLEAFERYIVLAVLFYTCPLAFSTIALGTGEGNAIFCRWVEMIMTALLVLMLNLFFLGVFYTGFIHVFDPGVGSISLVGGSDAYLDVTAESVFSNGTEFVLKMCLLIAWLTVGQKVDEMLRTLGFSSAKTGKELGSAVISGIGASVFAAKSALKMARGGMGTIGDFKNARRQNMQNDIERQGAENILRGAGDAHDTVRASSTSSELEASMAGTRDAFTSDIIGSDDKRPIFNDKDTRETLASLGVTAPAYGEASLSDGKASFTDSAGDITYEAGDASRWQAPDGIASFTEETEGGFSVVHAASQEEIDDAQGKMLSSLESNPSTADGITWQPQTDSEGKATGLAIGYDESGSAKYAASVDGVASVDSSYGGIYEYQDTQGNSTRMSGVSLEGSAASYSVHDLQDTEHQNKLFIDEESFKSSGVEFKRAADSPILTRKTTSEQDAYSIANSKNKLSWKSSSVQKEREVQQAKKSLARTNPRFESAKQKTLRGFDKIKDKAKGLGKQDRKK